MIFVLVTTSIGAGALTLPYVLKQNGIVLGCFFLIFGALVSYISMRILMWASYDTNITDYGKLVTHCCGKVKILFLKIVNHFFRKWEYFLIVYLYFIYSEY